MSKIVYTVRPLKKGERYATMQESVQNNKVGVFGLHKVDQKIIQYTQNKKMADKQQAATKMEIIQKMASARGKLSRAQRTLNDEMASEAQRTQAKNEIKIYGPEYNMWMKKFQDSENGKVEKTKPLAHKKTTPMVERRQPSEKSQQIAQSIIKKLVANKSHELTDNEHQMINQEMGQLESWPTPKNYNPADPWGLWGVPKPQRKYGKVSVKGKPRDNVSSKKVINYIPPKKGKKTMTKNLVSDSDLLRLYNAMDMMYIEVQQAIDFAREDTDELELYMGYVDDAMDEIGKFATIKRIKGKRTLINKGVDISMYNSLAREFAEQMDGLYNHLRQLPKGLTIEAKYYASKFPDLKIKNFRLL
jgi:hypothetical protein